MTTTVHPLPEPRVLDREHRAMSLGLVALVTMFAFEAVAVSLAMPSVAHALAGETLYPVAVVGLLTTAVIGMPLGGAWSDARGPATPIALGGAVFVAGLVLSGLAGSMELFVAGRLLQGLGCGAALTAMYVAVADAYLPELRPRVFALFASAWVLPSIAGPFVAGALVDLLGWRSVFLVVAGFAAASTLLVRFAMAGHLAVRAAPVHWGPRPAYAVLAAFAVLALHLAGHATGARAGILLLLGFVVLFPTLGQLLPGGTLRARPGLPAVVAARGVLGAAFACVEMFLPLLLQDETGLTPTVTGVVLMVGALGWSLGSAYSGRRAVPETYGTLLRAGAGCLLLGGLLTTLLVPVAGNLVAATALATVGFAAMAVGMGLATPLLSTLALELAAPGRQGESGSAIQMSDALGQSVAAGVVGAVFARWFVWDAGSSYLAGLGLAVLLALLAVGTVSRIRS